MHLLSYSPRSLTAPRFGALSRHFCLSTFLAITIVLIGHFATSDAFAQGHQHGAATQTAQTETPASPPTPTDSPAAPVAAAAAASNYHNPTTFTLRTGIAQGRMVYIGVGGDIDGQVNPTLTIYEGELIQINLINGEGAEHDIFVDHYNARSQRVVGRNASSTFSFTANDPGEFAYFCTIAGHRQAGMEGLIRVVAGPRAAPPLMARTSSAIQGTYPLLSASALLRSSRSTWRPPSLRAGSTTARRMSTGRSTARFLGHSYGCGSATPWRLGSKTRLTASWFIRSIFMPQPALEVARMRRRPIPVMRRW